VVGNQKPNRGHYEAKNWRGKSKVPNPGKTRENLMFSIWGGKQNRVSLGTRRIARIMESAFRKAKKEGPDTLRKPNNFVLGKRIY